MKFKHYLVVCKITWFHLSAQNGNYGAPHGPGSKEEEMQEQLETQQGPCYDEYKRHGAPWALNLEISASYAFDMLKKTPATEREARCR
jgi:hypothetical protein